MATLRKGYIQPINGIRLMFAFNPEEIKEDFEVGWAEIKIPGLPMPIYQYAGGGKREISFTLQIAYPGFNTHHTLGTAPEDSVGKVDDDIAILYSYGMPSIGSASIESGRAWQFFMPPILKLYLGRKSISCVMTKIGVARKFFDKELNTTVAEVEVTFAQVLVVNY